MDYPNVITMTANLEIDGENKVYRFYLQYMHQYEFTDSETRYRYSDDIDGLNTDGKPQTHVLHYKVESTDGLDYCWIPYMYTAIENRLRTPEEQDRRLYNENIAADQPRDHVQAYKDATGLDLDNFNRQEMHNGYSYYEKYLKEMHKNDGKVYGQTEPRT